MKKTFLCLTLLTLVVGLPDHVSAKDSASANLGDFRNAPKDRIPNNTYDAFTFEAAQKAAVKKKRPLAILVEPRGSKVLDSERDAAARVFWGLQEECIMVVVNKGNWNPLPEIIKVSLQAPALGKEAPRVIILADDSKTALVGLNAEKLSAMTAKELEALGKECKKLNATKTASATFPPPAPQDASK